MKRIICFIVFPLFLLADYTHFDGGLGLGYRQDKIVSIQTQTIPVVLQGTQDLLSLDWHKLRSVDLTGFCKLYVRNIMMQAQGNIGWIQSGDLEFLANFVNPPTIIIPFRIHSKVKGYVWDGLWSAGYAIPLVPGRSLLFFVPQAGYSINYQKLQKKTSETVVGSDPNTGIVLTVQAFLPENEFRRKWQGWFVGGDILFDLADWVVEFGYFRHYPHFLEKQRLINRFILSPIGTDLFQQIALRASENGGKGHRLQGRVRYSFTDLIKLEVLSGYLYFKGPKVHATALQELTSNTGITHGPITNINLSRADWHSFFITLQFVLGF